MAVSDTRGSFDGGNWRPAIMAGRSGSHVTPSVEIMGRVIASSVRPPEMAMTAPS